MSHVLCVCKRVRWKVILLAMMMSLTWIRHRQSFCIKGWKMSIGDQVRQFSFCELSDGICYLCKKLSVGINSLWDQMNACPFRLEDRLVEIGKLLNLSPMRIWKLKKIALPTFPLLSCIEQFELLVCKRQGKIFVCVCLWLLSLYAKLRIDAYLMFDLWVLRRHSFN